MISSGENPAVFSIQYNCHLIFAGQFEGFAFVLRISTAWKLVCRTLQSRMVLQIQSAGEGRFGCQTPTCYLLPTHPDIQMFLRRSVKPSGYTASLQWVKGGQAPQNTVERLRVCIHTDIG